VHQSKGLLVCVQGLPGLAVSWILVILSEQPVLFSGDHRMGCFMSALIVSLRFLSVYLMLQYQELQSLTLVFIKLTDIRDGCSVMWYSAYKGKAADSSEMLVTAYQSTQRHVPEDCSLAAYCCDNIVFQNRSQGFHGAVTCLKREPVPGDAGRMILKNVTVWRTVDYQQNGAEGIRAGC
jgi:hypothetical protein